MRNELRYTVQLPGRDKGKTYLITEFSADKGERWAIRVFFALLNAGVQLPKGIETMGMEAMAAAGFDAVVGSLSRVTFDVAAPLLNEMLDGVQLIPDISRPELTRNLLPEDIEEISTRILLRKEVWSLNTSFLAAVTGSTSKGSKADPSGTTQPTQISPT